MDVATDRLCVLFKGEMIVQSNDESFDCIRGRNGRACNGGLTDSGRRQQIISPVSQKKFSVVSHDGNSGLYCRC